MSCRLVLKRMGYIEMSPPLQRDSGSFSSWWSGRENVTCSWLWLPVSVIGGKLPSIIKDDDNFM